MTLTVQGSLRKRLLVALLGSLAVIWLVTGGIGALQMDDQVHELFDAKLAQNAAPLVHEIEEEYPQHAFDVFKYSPNIVFQIWERGAQLQLRSTGAPSARLAKSDSGFADSVIDGREWRVFSAWDESHTYLVQVGELKSERRKFSREIIEQLLQSLALALPLFGATVWLVVGLTLRPVARLRDEIAQRDAKNLQPIAGAVPAEIAPLAERLNELLARVQSSLTSERRFTSDAAHELRTPLAALKSQIQVALGANDSAQQKHALENALLACDRATHRVEQMLILARLEQDVWNTIPQRFDLHALAAQALAEVAAFAGKKHIELALEGEANTFVEGHSGLWAILLRNLLDNAVRYAPENSAVVMRIVGADAELELSITDQGPGIAADKIEQALARFQRLQHSDEGGSGLGLSIVARIVALHGATLTLTTGADGRGLCARVSIKR